MQQKLRKDALKIIDIKIYKIIFDFDLMRNIFIIHTMLYSYCYMIQKSLNS